MRLAGRVAPRLPEPAQSPVEYGIGANARRPDGMRKVRGEFAYSSDLWADEMLWGATARSPHPHARIRSIDTAPALAIPGVQAVLTHADVPGRQTYGVEISDQPVLSGDVVRYRGEPIAIVAADHPETARLAAASVAVEYEPREPLTDPLRAAAGEGPLLHPGGNVVRRLFVRRGELAAARERADVVVRETYEIGMQDQAFLGPESGLAFPAEDGGVDLFVATQWLHSDLEQVAPCLDLPPEKVRITNAGVGGAFGGREDLSIQIHACLLARRTGKPVKMVYGREESFIGHVHRHPAQLEYEHGATRDGRLVFVRAKIVLDGGAYASSSPSVAVVASSFAVGPYECDVVDVEACAVYTNNPPCGAMRGFGAVQACFGYESQMDRLARAVGLDSLELRRRNAVSTGSTLAFGQQIDGPAPVVELLDRLASAPLPSVARSATRDLRELPGGVSNTTHGEGIRRGIGYAVSIKSVGFSDGFDDNSTARVRVSVVGGEPQIEIHSAVCENGQGIAVVQAQIARTELGIERAIVLPADTASANAGSTAASKQTWLTGGAVKSACEAVRANLLRRAVDRVGEQDEPLMLRDGIVATESGREVIGLAELISEQPIDETRTYRARPTVPRDENGQGGVSKLAFAFAAHRAVVDVDTELGLAKVVEMVCAQDVGKAINPQAVAGQIAGGTAQGIGLALMEEIQVRDGIVRNPSFTDYLIPTILDMPPLRIEILEHPQPHAPYGVNGVGEAPCISATPAVVAALRHACGQPLTRIPVSQDDLIGLERAPGRPTDAIAE